MISNPAQRVNIYCVYYYCTLTVEHVFIRLVFTCDTTAMMYLFSLSIMSSDINCMYDNCMAIVQNLNKLYILSQYICPCCFDEKERKPSDAFL